MTARARPAGPPGTGLSTASDGLMNPRRGWCVRTASKGPGWGSGEDGPGTAGGTLRAETTAAVRSGRNRHDHGVGYLIVSLMCSTVEGRLALIGEAIDEVAAALTAGELSGAGTAEVAARLARIWAMLAELDPALAGRLRDYSPDPIPVRDHGTGAAQARPKPSS